MKTAIAAAVLAAALSGCAQSGLVRRAEEPQAREDARACQAELTRLIWAGEKPLLTGRWFRKCMAEKGWKFATVARVMP